MTAPLTGFSPDPIAGDPPLAFCRAECPSEADRLLALGLVRPFVADVLVSFDAADSRDLRARAADLLIRRRNRGNGSEWVVGFASAAWLHTGSAAGTPPAAELQVIVPPGRRRPTGEGIRGRALALSPTEVMSCGPVQATIPVRTAADVARDLPPATALPILQRLAELTDVHPHQVTQLLARMRYARGTATARRTVQAWAEQSPGGTS